MLTLIIIWAVFAKRARKALEDAVKAYKKAISLKPDFAEVRSICVLHYPVIKPKSAPREYVEKLFDGYAKRFEVSLVDTLDYKIPKLIKDILIKVMIVKGHWGQF